MSFETQQMNWQGLAETDPYWAVLSEPDKRGGGWEEERFYSTGVKEAFAVMGDLKGLGLEPNGRGLDVGCGPGRVTHALAEYFEQMVGYDISPEMLELARKSVWENPALPCDETFVLNETDDLAPFDDESFDFVYCNRVLQHIDHDRVGLYLSEMVRVLKPGGVLFCQMLSHPSGNEGTRESSPDPKWRYNGIIPHYTVCFVGLQDMVGAFFELGVTIHQIRLVDKGEGQSILSYEYVVSK